MRLILTIFIVLALISIASADIGPSPDAPDITIRFEEGNSTYFAITDLAYHCSVESTNRTSPVDDREINMSCVAGLCKNDNWFYKLNPCYYSSGYFSYLYNGKTINTEVENFSDSRTYDYTVDVASGKYTSKVALPGEAYDVCCAPSFIVAGILGLAFVMRKHNG